MKYLSHLILSLAFLFTSAVLADTPVGPMNYQGRLLDNNGIPLTGSYNFSVSVFDAISGGTLKYRELHNAVAVDDGVYSFLVGTKTKDAGDSTWSIELWNCCGSLYLEIAVNGETLSPRHQLTAAPYAFQANLALTTNNALALGGKPSSWFDSTLEAICASGKGKWLELANGGAGACLGAGSSYPGPTLTSWNALTTDNDFSNLDLSRADISGISFNGANLTGSLFKETTYQVISFQGANLTSTVWDGAIATGSMNILPNYTILVGITFKNMDMSNWNLSALSYIRYDKMSAAYLSACPAGLPTNPFAWECRDMGNGSGLYVLIGPYGNYSSTSAAAIDTLGGKVLDLGRSVFDNAPNMYNSIFTGVRLTQDFKNTTLQNVNMDYTTVIDANFDGTWFSGVSFKKAVIERTNFSSTITYFSDVNMSDARLNYVDFQIDANIMNFSRASLHQVDFTSLKSVNFTGAVLDDVRINTKLEGNWPSQTIFDGTKIMGDFYVADFAPGLSYNYYFLFKDVKFVGTRWSGDFAPAVFTGTTLFKEVELSHLDLCYTNIPLVDTTAPHDDLSRIKWTGPVECPDGSDATGGASTCNTSTGMSPTGQYGCTTGIP
jgi:uncharacterized protein YjbI with pentapeptide repeats